MKRISLDDYQIISMDFGRSWVKAKTEFEGQVYETKFKSIVGDGRDIDLSKYKNPIYINVQGEDLFIGDLALKESHDPIRNSKDSKTTMTVQTLFHAVISEIAFTDKIKVLFTVPNDNYIKTVLKEIQNTYKDKCFTVKDNISNTVKTVEVIDVEIFRESDSLFYNVFGGNVNDERPTVFCSIGFKTMEVSTFEVGGIFNDKLSTTIHYGQQDILTFVRSQLKNDGIIKDLMEIDSNNTDYNEYKKRANKWASESVQQRLQSFLPNEGKEHDIFIAGGTSIALEFEDNFIKISDPQMATAQGAYYVATMLFE